MKKTSAKFFLLIQSGSREIRQKPFSTVTSHCEVELNAAKMLQCLPSVEILLSHKIKPLKERLFVRNSKVQVSAIYKSFAHSNIIE